MIESRFLSCPDMHLVSTVRTSYEQFIQPWTQKTKPHSYSKPDLPKVPTPAQDQEYIPPPIATIPLGIPFPPITNLPHLSIPQSAFPQRPLKACIDKNALGKKIASTLSEVHLDHRVGEDSDIRGTRNI